LGVWRQFERSHQAEKIRKQFVRGAIDFLDEEFFDSHRGIWWRIDTLIVTGVDRTPYNHRSVWYLI
jgi:hypothetical protein